MRWQRRRSIPMDCRCRAGVIHSSTSPNRAAWCLSPAKRLRINDGKVVGVGDARAQTRFVLEKIRTAVEAAGGTINDVVAMSVFSTDVKFHRDINETRREVLGANFPTSTMVQVVALARPELLLEINAIAVIS